MCSKAAVWLFGGALAMMTFMVPPVQGEIEFGIPRPLTLNVINDDGANVHGWLSPNELTLHFASSRGLGFATDIFVSTRDSTSSEWQTPVTLGSPVNAPNTFNYILSLTADEKEIYYTRATDPLGASDAELWVAKRPSVDADWGEPEKLSFTVPGDFFPVISPDGHNLYFSSFGRDSDESPTVGNIWATSRTSLSDSFGEPVFVQSGVGSHFSTDSLTFAFYGNNEHFEFYDVPRVGQQDVLLRTRDVPDGEFGPVFNPWAPLNSSSNDYITQFAPSGKSVLLVSTRPGVPPNAIFGLFGIWEAPIADSVPVDIKPGGDTAPINLKSKGKLPVAILSTDEFDATQVDAETLLFGDPLLIADGQTPVSPLRWAYEYVNDDDLLDLTLKFSMRDIVGNGVMGPMTMEGYLAGQTFDGLEIAGRETVRIVPRKVFESTTFTVPEPTSLALVLVGLIGVLALRR